MNDIEKIQIQKEISDVVVFIDNIFDEALIEGASDIHIEPTRDFLLIRFRKDWDFIIKNKIASENIPVIITRLKVLAKVKIDESKKPQDGKIVYKSEKTNEIVDIRVSTFPTVYWEKVVMRILKQDDSMLNLDSIWFLDINLEKVKKSLESKYGIILVAWPTWSGKTTTLFSILKNFNPLEYNISTLEDPVEYNIDYINQSQIKPEIWYDFASWLRSLVRQDPDIIMVWEIRDRETASLAIEAALTWHLVLSTIHTNSASATIWRLINMWLEPFLIASALKIVISQRLVKKICPYCKIENKIESILKEKVKKELINILNEDEIDEINFYKWVWCEKCNNTWYSWRIWVHEVLEIWDYIEKYILSSSSASEIKKIAQNNWMITIVQDALLKAAMWETTIEEAFTLI